MQRLFILLFGLVSVVGSLNAQEERILNYDTKIEVNKDRSIMVTDVIEVYVAGDVIKRGITRFLPKWRYLNDKSAEVQYRIREVLRDGVKEPYHAESSNDGKTLYIGREDVFLDPGVYTYTIRYHVPGQIGFYEDYDEIYWNAVGNLVQFDVLAASCEIHLPAGASILQDSAYTGGFGESEQDYTVERSGDVISYRTTKKLDPGESFTVAVGFDKGFVNEPGFFDRMGTLLVIILGMIFLLPYYIYTWMKHGIDPPTPPSYPLWDSPDGLSAASIGYIKKGSYDNKGFTASIIDLAIKGYLRIEEISKSGIFKSKKNYELVKIKDEDDALPVEEKDLMRSLFITGDRKRIDGKYDSRIESTIGSHRASLSGQHRDFIRKGFNTRLLVAPILITIAVAILANVVTFNSFYAAGISAISGVAFIPVAIIGLILYAYLIKQPTPEKLELRSRINGFEMYLEMTEKERLNLLNPPEMTPRHFEEALPFAFALGVEHKWSKIFEKILAEAQYRPSWNNASNPVLFTSHFGRDFSSTTRSAATPPAKSGSGSGGGGFSGGGGGGGGVGGW